jgi:dihydrofolate synthase/folylpolyglutamate synthase
VVYGKHWAVQKSPNGFYYADAYGQVELPMPALIGPHQLVNAGNAIAAISILEEFDIGADAIAAGLKWVQWAGRLEDVTEGILSEYLNLSQWERSKSAQTISGEGFKPALPSPHPSRDARRPLPMGEVNKSWQIYFDGGHNAAAGHILSVVAEEWSDKPLYVICGTTRGKEVAPMLLPLKDLAEEIYLVPVQAEPKCYTPQEMADQCEDAGIHARVADSVAEAVEEIVTMAEKPGHILIFGSLYLRLEVVEYP